MEQAIFFLTYESGIIVSFPGQLSVLRRYTRYYSRLKSILERRTHEYTNFHDEVYELKIDRSMPRIKTYKTCF